MERIRIHLNKPGDLRYYKAYMQYLAGRRETKPIASSYDVGHYQAIMIERFADEQAIDIRRGRTRIRKSRRA